MSYYFTLHQNMKRARLKANLTQAQVAEKVGITARQYQRYESGASAPYIYDLPKICEALLTVMTLPHHLSIEDKP